MAVLPRAWDHPVASHGTTSVSRTQATFSNFDPFWEFVSGPLNAGTFGPNRLDATFGPEVRFQKVADYANQPPSDGNQGAVLWSTTLAPA